MSRKQVEQIEVAKINFIKILWKNELDNPKSVWYKKEIIEHKVKELNPHVRQTTQKYLKSIKCRLIKDNSFLYSYSQREDAKFLKTTQNTIAKISKKLKTYFPIGFIKIKANNLFNGSKFQSRTFKTFIIPVTEKQFLKQFNKYYYQHHDIHQIPGDIHKKSDIMISTKSPVISTKSPVISTKSPVISTNDIMISTNDIMISTNIKKDNDFNYLPTTINSINNINKNSLIYSSFKRILEDITYIIEDYIPTSKQLSKKQKTKLLFMVKEDLKNLNKKILKIMDGLSNESQSIITESTASKDKLCSCFDSVTKKPQAFIFNHNKNDDTHHSCKKQIINKPFENSNKNSCFDKSKYKLKIKPTNIDKKETILPKYKYKLKIKLTNIANQNNIETSKQNFDKSKKLSIDKNKFILYKLKIKPTNIDKKEIILSKYKLKIKSFDNSQKIMSTAASPTKPIKQYKDYFLEEYGINRHKLMPNIELHKFISYNVFPDLAGYQFAPRILETLKLIKKWNTIDNSRFVHHQLNAESKTFNMICALVSYRILKHKITIDELMNAVDTFDHISNGPYRLKMAKKLRMLGHFLWNDTSYTGIDWFQICLEEKDTAMQMAFGSKLKYDNTFDRVKAHYTRLWCEGDERRAHETIIQNWYKFKRFSEALVEDHKTRHMYGMRMDTFVRDLMEFLFDKHNFYARTRSLDETFHARERLHYGESVRRSNGWTKFFDKKETEK